MIGQGGEQDAQADRQRLAESRGQQEGQQLGLVADFGQGNEAGRDEECFDFFLSVTVSSGGLELAQ